MVTVQLLKRRERLFMFDVNDCISNSIDLNYLLGKFVLDMRAVIRIFDKD